MLTERSKTMKYKDMDKHQQLVVRTAKAICNYEIGGWINLIYDGDDYADYIPATREDAVNWVCNMVADEAPKEARFAGKEFLEMVVRCCFKKDADIEEIAYTMNWK